MRNANGAYASSVLLRPVLRVPWPSAARPCDQHREACPRLRLGHDTRNSKDRVWNGTGLLLCFSTLGLLVLGACSTARDHAAIEHVLHVQDAAWNRGDIPAFMEHYVNSDDLTFSSGGQTTRGWSATLQRYVDRYPDRAAMGKLAFSDLEITLLSPSAALVLGRWHLTRDAGDIGGNFSLVFRKIAGRWLILHDHTSRSRDDSTDSG